LFSSEALAIANAAGDVLDLADHPSAIPQIDLDDTAYGGLTVDGDVWWRIQYEDGAGLKSGWSDPAKIHRTSKPTLTITNPASGGTPFVNDPTPPFAWTFAGQTKAEVILSTPESPHVPIWSTIINGTENNVTPPDGKITEVNKTYRLTVRTWDAVTRVAVPDDPPYTEAVRDFVFQLSNTVSGVTGLTGVTDLWKPQATLEWDRATAPDSFPVLRDGEVVADLIPSEVLVSGTHYRWVDTTARSRHSHEWSVAAKVNNVTSSVNPTYVGTIKPVTTTLADFEHSRIVYLLDPNVDAERTETSDVHYLLGDAPPVLISQSIRGYEGSVAGILANNVIPGVTAEDQLNNLLYFRKQRGMRLKLAWVDKVMRVVLRQVTDTPIARPDGSVEYLVSFSFFEDDFS
jgi:hypothetical protein